METAQTTFQLQLRDPDAWREIAESLASSAAALRWRRCDLLQHGVPFSWPLVAPELLLWAYALETFLKCLYVKQGKPLPLKHGNLKWHHHLHRLATETGVSCTKSDCRVLKQLTRALVWAGRYPVARTSKETFEGAYWRCPEDDDVLDALLRKLRQEIGIPPKGKRTPAPGC